MSEFLVQAGNAVGTLAFAAACVVFAITPTRKDWYFNAASRWFLLAACAVYVFVSASDFSDGMWPVPFGEFLEDYVEMLFPVLILMASFAALSAQQMGDLKRSQRALAQSHDLLAGVVDAAPSGIMLVDQTSAIVFANPAAQEVLDLEEDEMTGRFSAPWFDEHGAPGALRPVLSEQHRVAVPLIIEWPGGWRVSLSVNTEPLMDAHGRFAGVVATFERPPAGAQPGADPVDSPA